MFRRAAVPITTIPSRPRTEVITYAVHAGDSVFGIAEQMGISGDTIMWANGDLEDNPDLLSVGQALTILPVSGVYHEVVQGDTLESIAKKYQVTVDAITGYEFSGLAPGQPLEIGKHIIVAGGRKPFVARAAVVVVGGVPDGAQRGTGALIWPTSGMISQGYWEYHLAVDIAGPLGSPVVAADSGYVASIQDTDYGYGRCVVIDHGNGIQTLYSHLQAYYVKVGQSVGRGQAIGTRGSTGNSTGPHLHFEVIQNGVQRNPLIYLP